MFLQEWFECKEINPEVIERREWNEVSERETKNGIRDNMVEELREKEYGERKGACKLKIKCFLCDNKGVELGKVDKATR